MDNQQQHQNIMRTNQESDHHHHQSCSSNSSSPSHEFSFTISFQQTNQTPPLPSSSSSTTTSSSSFAIDLSPADDIFFHGHLLPLHLLSHFPISSPRSSTNSLDGFTLPKKNHDFFHQQHNKVLDDDTSCCDAKAKSKSFSLFGIPKWRVLKDQNKERSSKQYSKKMSQVVKRYIKMVRPFLSFRNKKINMQFHSFSGNLLKQNNNNKNNKWEYSSAPASIRTSPTNSGLLVAKPTGGDYSNFTNSSSDSTMEELQSAIQAAIAHCKKSISMED
ncbi:BRI1 kinase inhibitor 1 [Solanum lycopersicum]|uniref:BRI1 kinase inhibitor 1 n=1 Tax=Solanum lycopersicum TaxID=4081 RepID=UPI0008FEC6E0|nr:BRI1 kinase inhibitor 1 [Solanum lycopersicum]